jgi:general secretion pathway protein F
MGAFEYVALNPKGREEKGVREGDNPRHIRQILRDAGLVPLKVSEVRGGAATSVKDTGRKVHRRGMSLSELALVTRQLATLVRAGLPLEKALRTGADQAEKRNTQRILLAVRSKVAEGHSFAKALADFPAAFPDLYRATVNAGEQSGHLDAVLDRLADYVEMRQGLQQNVTLALVYPAVLTSLALLIVAGLLTYVVPEVVQVFAHMGQDLPDLTRALMATSDFARNSGVYVVAAIALSVWLARRALRNPAVRTRWQQGLLRVPLVSALIRNANTARFTRTLSTLVGSGVPMLDALYISGEVVNNLPMRAAIAESSQAVREGGSLSAALARSKLFPPLTVQLIASGEGSGELPAMLERAANQQEQELRGSVTTLLRLFEPLLILVMGGVVLLIVIAILLPVFELNQMVK